MTRKYDEAIERIASYVVEGGIESEEAYAVARLCLLDSLGCALLALNFPACIRVIETALPSATIPCGCRVPGKDWQLETVSAAFAIGTMIRWLDYNDTWLGKEWAHPSDNFGGLLAVADHLCRTGRRLQVFDLLIAAIKAYEIQGILALENSLNRIGLDHVILVRVATAAIATHLLGGDREKVRAAISQAWIDGGSLRCYRHAPNTGSRKSWAAGDATARGVLLSQLTMSGEPGYPTALSAPKWGFYDVFLQGKPFLFARDLGSYVMENILFKISFPAEFHAQTAVEAAIYLHPFVRERIEDIAEVRLLTHESAVRIIDKTGPLHNPADRDHCLQYMVAIGLLHGYLVAEHYEDEEAADPRVDRLRAKMVVEEEPRYSRDYLDPDKRSIANSVTIRFQDGTTLAPIVVEYPIGHRRRRKEAIPLLRQKFARNAVPLLGRDRVDQLLVLFDDPNQLDRMSVADFMDLFATNR